MLLLFIITLLASHSQAYKVENSEASFQSCIIPVAHDFSWPLMCNQSPQEFLRIPERVLNWGSGGLGGRPWHFSDVSCNNFFANLARAISAYNPDIILSPHDLFHAHIISYERNAMALVFHAKEYPFDLEKAKNYYQLVSHRFYSYEESYQDRNFVYFSYDTKFAKKNTLYLVRNKDACRHWFDPDGVNTLSEKLITQDLPNPRRIGDVNIFIPESLINIAYNFGIHENILSGKSEARRLEANEDFYAFYQRLSQSGQPLVYMLTGL
jgi:hypothetical protein